MDEVAWQIEMRTGVGVGLGDVVVGVGVGDVVVGVGDADVSVGEGDGDAYVQPAFQISWPAGVQL